MTQGGSRIGAGRPKGSKSQKTRAVAVEAASKGIAPIEVILKIMRTAHAAGDDGVALDAASRAAPFIHPKLSAVQLDLGGLSEDELRQLAS